MPLYAQSIQEARGAYDVLEIRAVNAELHASILQRLLDEITIHEPLTIRESRILGDHVVEAVAKNVVLERQRDDAVAAKADIPLQAFVVGIGMTLAIAEQTMPDRAIPTASGSIRSAIVLEGGAIGLRFWQPELAGMVMSTTAFEITKIPSSGNAPAPRLFTVLQGKIALFGMPRWTGLAPTPALLVAASSLLGEAGSWTFASIVAATNTIAANESALASASSASAFRDATATLRALATMLTGKATPVAGDVYALVAALAATTRAAAATSA